MRQSNPLAAPVALPAPVRELAAQLEECGLQAYSHGEGLLAKLRAPATTAAANLAPAAHSLLCVGSAADVLKALPLAVVTAEGAARLTHPTQAGPVDLVICGTGPLEETLSCFGLGPFGFAFRPANETWIDPFAQRDALAAGRLEILGGEPNPFRVAPRRYWIAARLMSENGLEASEACRKAALEALPDVGDRLPQAAPARREISRILAAPSPSLGLAFLRESGVGALVFPGTKASNEERLAMLPELPSVRWAAWLRGSATARVLVRLRTPHALARRIERVQAHHPIERVVEAAREHGVRKLMQRLEPDEIEALFRWRRIELRDTRDPAEAADVEARLVSIEARILAAREAAERSGRVRSLALGGEEVMAVLDAGPGRHVGQALAHLARFIEEQPESNTVAALEEELADWARKNSLSG